MLAGHATVHVTYSKARNEVTVDVEARGLPYRPSFTKGVDDGNAFNHPLTSVVQARWQLWLSGTMFARQHEDVYFSNTRPRAFLGTPYDFQPIGPASPPVPGSYDTAQSNGRQMVGSELFEGDANGNAHFHWAMAYDRIADRWRSPGTINLVVPLEACAPDAMANYWTDTELPPGKFMTWDGVLASIWSGEGIGFMLTAEPQIQPNQPGSPRYRSSGFVGWANVYPSIVPDRFGLDYCTSGTLIPIHERSYQLPLWPPTSRRKPCRS